MKNEVGLFINKYIDSRVVQTLCEDFKPWRGEIISLSEDEEVELPKLPNIIIVTGGDGTVRHLVKRLYRHRKNLAQRDPLLLATLDKGGTISKLSRVLKISGRGMNSDQIGVLNENFKECLVPVAVVGEEPFLLDVGKGIFERCVWKWDSKLRGQVPRMLRVPFRHLLGGISSVKKNEMGGFILDTIFTNPIIGPKNIFPEQQFLGNYLTRMHIFGGSGWEEMAKLSLVLFYLQFGKKPPAWAVEITSAKTFHIPTRINPIALDGDLVNMPDDGKIIWEVKKKGWEIPMVVLTKTVKSFP